MIRELKQNKFKAYNQKETKLNKLTLRSMKLQAWSFSDFNVKSAKSSRISSSLTKPDCMETLISVETFTSGGSIFRLQVCLDRNKKHMNIDFRTRSSDWVSRRMLSIHAIKRSSQLTLQVHLGTVARIEWQPACLASIRTLLIELSALLQIENVCPQVSWKQAWGNTNCFQRLGDGPRAYKQFVRDTRELVKIRENGKREYISIFLYDASKVDSVRPCDIIEWSAQYSCHHRRCTSDASQITTPCKQSIL